MGARNDDCVERTTGVWTDLSLGARICLRVDGTVCEWVGRSIDGRAGGRCSGPIDGWPAGSAGGSVAGTMDGRFCGRIELWAYGRPVVRAFGWMGVWTGGRAGGQAVGANERRAGRRAQPWVFLCAERWAGVRSDGAMARRSDGAMVLRADRSAFAATDRRPEQWVFRCSGGWVADRLCRRVGRSVCPRTARWAAESAGGPAFGPVCLQCAPTLPHTIRLRFTGRAKLRNAQTTARTKAPWTNTRACGSDNDSACGRNRRRNGGWIRGRDSLSAALCRDARAVGTHDQASARTATLRADSAIRRTSGGTTAHTTCGPNVALHAAPPLPHPAGPRTGHRRLGRTRCAAREWPPEFPLPNRRMRTHPYRPAHTPPRHRAGGPETDDLNGRGHLATGTPRQAA